MIFIWNPQVMLQMTNAMIFFLGSGVTGVPSGMNCALCWQRPMTTGSCWWVDPRSNVAA
jgi:hypothetical protein